VTCPICGGSTKQVRNYDDDGSSFSVTVCTVCGWDDEEEQRLAYRDALQDMTDDGLDLNDYPFDLEDFDEYESNR
jgi:hypothetical protein